jgi:hypothetical protein
MIDITNYSPPPRKPDLLDELNALRSLRAQAYFANDSVALEAAHQQLKQFWLRNGWSEEEAQEAYEEAIRDCEIRNIY